MIRTEKLLEAVSHRTTSWVMTKEFKDSIKAKKYAAKLFTGVAQGVKVVSGFDYDHNEIFYVLQWKRRLQ